MTRLNVVASITMVLFATGACAQLVEIERNGASRHDRVNFSIESVDSAATDLVAEQRSIDFLGRSGAELSPQGPARALVQIVRLRIGEPGGFNLPLYFFVSPSGDILGGERQVNELTAASLVNPLGGTFNLSINKSHRLYGEAGKYTSFKLAYHASGKLLSGDDIANADHRFVAVVGYGDIGLLFQTGAWPEDDSGSTGVLWIQGKIGGSAASKANMQRFFGTQVDGSFASWNLDAGIEINSYLNLKLGMSKAIDVANAPAFDKPFYKLAFDFKPRR